VVSLPTDILRTCIFCGSGLERSTQLLCSEVCQTIAKVIPPRDTSQEHCLLFLATADGNLWLLQHLYHRLLRRTTYLSFSSSSALCALSVREGHVELLQWLKTNLCASLWNEQHFLERESPCHLAAQTGHLQILQWLR
jgi:hypothetical protein